MKYKEAYDKLINAYFKDQIKPYDRSFCFCGTIGRSYDLGWDHSKYSGLEYHNMEAALLDTISIEMTPFIPEMRDNKFARSTNRSDLFEVRKKLEAHPEYENAIFEGFVNALEVLRKIHISRGEIIEPVKLTKRTLV